MDKNKITNDMLTKATGIRTFQLLANVTGYLEGELEDWPSAIQDDVYAALERMAEKVELPLTIVFSTCGKDEFSAEEHPTFYIYVVASEIVATNDVLYREEKEKMRHIIADIVSGRRTH